MTRTILHSIETAPDASRPYLQNSLKGAGFISNLLAVLANSPAVIEAYSTVSGINARTSLSLAEREVVQLIAASTHGCGFCVAGHSAVADKKAKIQPSVLSALRSGGTLPDERLEALAAFARAVIRRRGAVSDAEYQVFQRAGYDATNALDVILGVSLATLCNFANNFAQAPLNQELSHYRWEGLPGGHHIDEEKNA